VAFGKVAFIQGVTRTRTSLGLGMMTNLIPCNPGRHLMRRTNMINRRVLLSTSLALLPTLWPQTAVAQQTTRVGSRSFSFAVYGDSRSMMYVPYKSDQRDEAIKLMVDIFALVLPEKVAEESSGGTSSLPMTRPLVSSPPLPLVVAHSECEEAATNRKTKISPPREFLAHTDFLHGY
jgi:hypothetical protein